MRIIGGLIPFIGFTTYIVDDDPSEYPILIKMFELRWFGRAVGFIYSAEEFIDEERV